MRNPEHGRKDAAQDTHNPDPELINPPNRIYIVKINIEIKLGRRLQHSDILMLNQEKVSLTRGRPQIRPIGFT